MGMGMGMVTLTGRRLRGQGEVPGSPAPRVQGPPSTPVRPAGPLGPQAPAQAHGALRPTARPQGATRPWGVDLLRGAAFIGLLSYAAHSLLGPGGHASDGVFEDWVFNALLLSGAALCLWRAACSEAERGAWGAMGLGLACWAAGEIIFTLDPGQVTQGSFPGLSDLPCRPPQSDRAGRPQRFNAARCARGCRALGSARSEARAGQRIRVRVHIASFGRRLLSGGRGVRVKMLLTGVLGGHTVSSAQTITLRSRGLRA